MPAATNKPQPYAQSPQPELKGSLQPWGASISKNFDLIEASIRQIIAYLFYLGDLIADLAGRVTKIEKEIIIIEDTLDGIVNAALFNRGPGNTQQLNAATILAAAASITGLPKTLYLKRGTWVIDADVDLSAMASSLLLAPGAELQQVGLFVFSLPLNVNIPDQGFHFSGDTGFIVPLPGSKITLDPRWWGALETSDSTAPLVIFEEAVYVQESSMVLPAGDYGFNGRWQVRMGIAGYNVNIIQLDASVQAAVADSTVYATGVAGFFIRGLVNINSADARVSLHMYDCDEAELAGLTMEHSIHMGLYLAVSDRCWIHECHSNYVQYVSNPSTGKSADGFYQLTCRDNKYENCTSFSVERICFVSEGVFAGPFPSYNPSYFRCTGDYAHNMDHSTSEFNGAFWLENTNGGNLTECNAVNISNGVAQTRSFSNAFQIGGGQTEYCDYNFTRCKIYGNASLSTAQPARGFSAFGASSYSRVNIVDCSADRVYQAVALGEGIREGNVIRLTVSNSSFPATTAPDACSVIITTSNAMLSLNIDTLSEENTTRDVNGGSILFYQAAPNCVCTIKNSKGINAATTLATATVLRLLVSDCAIAFGNSVRSSFSSIQAKFARCTLTYRAASNARLWSYTGAAAGAGIEFDACDFIFGTVAGWPLGAQTANFKMQGGSITGGFIRIDNTVSCTAMFSGVLFDYPAANGAVQAGPFCTTIQVTGCTATTAIVPTASIPFQNYLAGPANSILTGNFSRVGAAITNWPAANLANNALY